MGSRCPSSENPQPCPRPVNPSKARHACRSPSSRGALRTRMGVAPRSGARAHAASLAFDPDRAWVRFSQLTEFCTVRARPDRGGAAALFSSCRAESTDSARKNWDPSAGLQFPKSPPPGLYRFMRHRRTVVRDCGSTERLTPRRLRKLSSPGRSNRRAWAASLRALIGSPRSPQPWD